MKYLSIPRRLLSLVSLASSSPSPLFIVSIGNPEPEYAGTRHNAGHWMLAYLEQQRWLPSGARALRSTSTYMNLQGPAVARAWTRIAPRSPLVILHDELQVEMGKVQLRAPGLSARGHNGLKSITATIGTNYHKISIGIGHPKNISGSAATRMSMGPGADEVSRYVLGRLSPQDEELLVAAAPRVRQLLEQVSESK